MKAFLHKAANAVTGQSGLTGQTMMIGGNTITVEEKIAEGGYGSIYKASGNYGRTYALKCLQAPDKEHLQLIEKEFEIQQKCCKHPNVVKVFGMQTEPRTRQTLILMEFCQSECIKEMNSCFNQGFSVPKIIEIFSQVCEAVNYMHELNPPIIHRDLKVENILYNEGKYKLCDFGSATTRVYKLETTSERNEATDDIQRNTTPNYRSPEMCDLYRRQVINFKSDVWAIGGILFKLATFKDAFPDGSNLQILNCNYRWPTDRNVHPKIKKIVEMCFVSDPEKRPTVREVLGALAEEFPDLVDQKWKMSSSSRRKLEPEPEPVQTYQNQSYQAPQEEFDPRIQIQNTQMNACRPPSGGSSPIGSPSSRPAFNPFMNQQQPQNSFQNFQQSSSQPVFLNFGAPQQQQPQQQQYQPAPVAQNSQLIDMSEPQKPVEAPAMIDLSANVSTLDTSRIENDRENLIKELLAMNDSQLSSALYSINNVAPTISVPFILAILHASGERAVRISQYMPIPSHKELSALLEAHKIFSSNYPQFEGNFALGKFMIANKANPPPPGQPPICHDAVTELLSIITASVSALRICPQHDIAEEGFCAYQATAYLIAKLKQFKINEGYIDAAHVPAMKNYHCQLKKQFDAMPEKIPFPAEPFDFSSVDFLKKIRAPSSRH